jgi:hypothetical protein
MADRHPEMTAALAADHRAIGLRPVEALVRAAQQVLGMASSG